VGAPDASTERAGLVVRPGEAEHLAGQERPTLSDRLPRAWLFPLAVFAVLWLLTPLAWYGSDAIEHQSHPWIWHFVMKDGAFYQSIAQYGYTGDSAKGAFFPLFPLLIHLVSYLTGGNYAIAGLITSIACGAAASVAVWALADRVRGRRVADRAVLLFCVFPGAMTFALLYSEPLAVALGAAALLALLDRRWLLAGIIGALATAERPDLIVLVVVSGVTAAEAIWTRREWRAMLAPALTPLGVLAFFCFVWYRYHSLTYWFSIENRDWHQHFDGGINTVRVLLWLDPREVHHEFFVVMLTIMFLAAFAGIGLMLAARLPLPLSLFAILTIVMILTSSNGGAKPRFVWTAFPIFIGAAAKLPRAIYWPVVIVSAAGLFLFIGAWQYVFRGPASP
jgi:Dolichyl-phosphate-mannose-protein mannosyltransferase